MAKLSYTKRFSSSKCHFNPMQHMKCNSFMSWLFKEAKAHQQKVEWKEKVRKRCNMIDCSLEDSEENVVQDSGEICNLWTEAV